MFHGGGGAARRAPVIARYSRGARGGRCAAITRSVVRTDERGARALALRRPGFGPEVAPARRRSAFGSLVIARHEGSVPPLLPTCTRGAREFPNAGPEQERRVQPAP